MKNKFSIFNPASAGQVFQFTILIGIVLLAIFFRLYRLSDVPPHPSLDEVSIGYNAYSILKTGADEYGERFPILLRAYDDWRPALYVYLVIPFVKLFGINVFAVRLPSVLLSILTIIATYFLVRELLGRKFEIRNSKFEIPAIAAAMLAVSPWHVYFSRIGHEWNGALSFFIFGLLFFLRFVNSKKAWSLIIASICFTLSFDFYQSTKIFIPLFLVCLLVLFRKELLSNKKIVALSGILGFLLMLPILVASASPNALIRFQGTNIFEVNKDLFKTSAERIDYDVKTNNLLGMVFDNRRFLYILIPTRAYLSHFNVGWLFSNSGDEPFKVPNFGLLYLFELPLIILGAIYLMRTNDVSKPSKLVLLFWVLTSIVPASITTGYPHATRIYNILPSPQIIAAVGLYYLLHFLTPRRWPNGLLGGGFLGIMLLSVLWFYHAYFVNFKRELSQQFQYGVIESLSYADSITNQYDKVIVSNKNNLFQSYMFYLFMKKYDPYKYQKLGGTISGGFAASHKIGKFEFTSNVDPRGRAAKILYVINPNELPEESLNIIQRVKFLDGRDAVWVVKEK